MIVDTSAIVAVLRREPDEPQYSELLGGAGPTAMSAGTYLETCIVVDRSRDPVLGKELDDLLGIIGIRIEPVTKEQADVARQAYRDFGKGSGHPAQLNLGDCFTYALARVTGEPVLYKGTDFELAGIPNACMSS